MKKILTTTVMTAILATSGFSAQQGSTEQKDAVGAEIYSYEEFRDGTDVNDTTIMPSGRACIGCSSKTPVIASTWTLEEGAIVNVSGNGFKLTGQININPKDSGALPSYSTIGASEKLYYVYYDSKYNYYYKLTDDTGCYLCYDGTAPSPQPDGKDLTLAMNGCPSGFPLLDDMDASRSATQIDMAYDAVAQKVQGRICGGTVTHAPSGATILSADSKTTFADDSSLTGKTKYTLTTADGAGFQEEYLRDLLTLKYTIGEGDNATKTLDLSDTSDYTAKLSDTSTLEDYLHSFGFYPNITTVLSGTGYDLLATKGADAAIQIPKNTKFSTAANSKIREIKANLHNVGSEAFTEALSFTGANATEGTQDTLVFSGDNSNLVPAMGVTYSDVKVTVCDEDAWIKTPKGKTVTFGGTSNPTLKIDADMKVSHRLEVKSGSKFEIAKGKTVKFFGAVTLGG